MIFFTILVSEFFIRYVLKINKDNAFVSKLFKKKKEEVKDNNVSEETNVSEEVNASEEVSVVESEEVK